MFKLLISEEIFVAHSRFLGTHSGKVVKTIDVFDTILSIVVPNVPKIVQKTDAVKVA